VEFVDPNSRMAHFHRYSMDLQCELPDHLVVDLGYLGRSEEIWLVEFLRRAAQYQPAGPEVPRAWNDTPGTGSESVLRNSARCRHLVQRDDSTRQLLRPYPQFDGVYMLRSNQARSRYDAMILTAERRLAGGWSAQANYTWSRQLDSQFNESNFFAGGSSILNNYDVAPSTDGRRSTRRIVRT